MDAAMKTPQKVHPSLLLHLPRYHKATMDKPRRLHLLKEVYQHLTKVEVVLRPQ
jgi:hypothetical protein